MNFKGLYLIVFLFINSSFITSGGLNYLLRTPKIKSNKPPLLVLLHGYGSNEKDLFSFAENLPGKYLIISLRAPINLGNEGYAWYRIDRSSGKMIYDYNEVVKSKKQIFSFIDELYKNQSFDKSQVYFCGFSQGAIMSLDIALSNPEKVKGVALLSGRLLNEAKINFSSTEKFKDIRIFISHGTKDPVIEIQNAREANIFLKTINNLITYKEYSDVHTINNDMFRDLLVWLNK